MRNSAWHNSVLVLLLGMASAPALAATSGSITLMGSVPPKTAIVVAPVAGYNALDLGAGGTDVTVANVTELNNTRDGYAVTLTSANGGRLLYVQNGNTLGSVAYTAKYNNQSAMLSTGGATVTSVAGQNSPVNLSKALTVSFPGDPNGALLSGTYSDMLTFQITAN